MRKIFAFGTVACLMSIASSSFALPSNEVERIYYSDATHRDVVGSETIMTCWGRPHGSTLEGQRTRFYQSVSTPCDLNFSADAKDEVSDSE